MNKILAFLKDIFTSDEKKRLNELERIRREELDAAFEESEILNQLILEYSKNSDDKELMISLSKSLETNMMNFVKDNIYLQTMVNNMEKLVGVQKAKIKSTDAGKMSYPIDKKDYYETLKKNFSVQHQVFQSSISACEKMLQEYIREEFQIRFIDDSQFIQQSSVPWLLSHISYMSRPSRIYNHKEKEMGKLIILLGMFTKYCCLDSRIKVPYLP